MSDAVFVNDARVMSKGQVTIPKNVRAALGVTTGDRVTFVVNGNEVRVINSAVYALKRFREEGFEIGDTESPIIPLYVRDVEKTFLVTALAFKAGVFINPVIPPACAPQDTLVRYALMATHTKEQVDRSVVALKKIFVEQGIIKAAV